MLDVLVIAPHPDDAEIGAGATMALLCDRGHDVGILDLTNGEPTPAGSAETRAREALEAAKVLGIAWRRCMGLANRSLVHDLDSRWQLAAMLRETRPRIILAPFWQDAHPDHLEATSLIEAARFWAKLTKTDLPGEPFHPQKIYYYFSLHLRMQEQVSFVIDISQHLDKKLRAVQCYQSQLSSLSASGSRGVIDDLRDRARYWGWLTGADYGEPFASREPIVLPALPELAR